MCRLNNPKTQDFKTFVLFPFHCYSRKYLIEQNLKKKKSENEYLMEIINCKLNIKSYVRKGEKLI